MVDSSNSNDESALKDSARRAPVQPTTPKKSFARRNWGKLTLLIGLGVPAAGLVIWTAVSMTYTYSAGERAGFVQKMSRKGWICKTWEGTLYTNRWADGTIEPQGYKYK